MDMVTRVEEQLQKAKDEYRQSHVLENLSIAEEDGWSALAQSEQEEIIMLRTEIEELEKLLQDHLEEEHAKSLIADAAEAVETIGEDELEEFAKREREQSNDIQ